jgi:hypothetical protein
MLYPGISGQLEQRATDRDQALRRARSFVSGPAAAASQLRSDVLQLQPWFLGEIRE